MYLIVWEFRAKPSARRRFAHTYGRRGPWVRLFRKARGFVSTQLLPGSTRSGTFFTIDIWLSRAAYIAAKRSLRREYAILDAACERLTASERRLGAFSIK